MVKLKDKITKIVLISVLILLAVVLCACKNIKYTVTFMVDNVEYAVVEAVSDREIEMPENPVKQGYEFVGWFMSNELESDTFSNLTVNKNVKVYARFTPKTYTVALNADGGECSQTSLSVVYGETFELPEPTKNGYAFLGWFDNNTLIEDGVWLLDCNSLTAKWEKTDIIITENPVSITLSTSEILPGETKSLQPLYVESKSNINSYIFVEISCETNEWFQYLEFNTNSFTKLQDNIYYLHDTTIEENSNILFTNQVQLSTSISNQFNGFSAEYTINFVSKSIQSSSMSVEDAYQILFN